jgi:hypothetical protein
LMGPRRNHFITKVAEEPGKVAVKRPGEIRTKPTPAVAQYGKREPVLLDFLENVPVVKERFVNLLSHRRAVAFCEAVWFVA